MLKNFAQPLPCATTWPCAHDNAWTTEGDPDGRACWRSQAKSPGRDRGVHRMDKDEAIPFDARHRYMATSTTVMKARQ